MHKLMITIFLLFFSSSVHAADGHHSSTTVTTIQLTDSIYVLQGKGGNVGVLIGADGVLMIDGDYADMFDQVDAAVDALSQSEIKFMINTHWHGDHTDNNEKFGQEAVIVAHENVRKRLSTKQVVELFNMVSEPKPEHALPSITFEQSMSFHFNGQTIDIIHFPQSHTDGDSVIFFREANVVHVADLLFNGFYPFVDVGTGGSVENLINSVDELINMIPADAKIIPGHGPMATLDDLKAYHQMLVEVLAIVQERIADGKSLEEIQEMSLPESITSVWADGFLSTDVWLGIVYNSINNK